MITDPGSDRVGYSTVRTRFLVSDALPYPDRQDQDG
jgi:hypothetical protein